MANKNHKRKATHKVARRAVQLPLFQSAKSPASKSKPTSLPKAKLDPKLTKEAKQLRQLKCTKQIYNNDIRLGHLLVTIDPSATSVRDIADRVVSRSRDPRKPDAIYAKLRGLREQIELYSQWTLEHELSQIALAVRNDERGAKILARYLGWDGQGGCTLQEVGDEYGITRERVRQICKRVLKNSLDYRISKPHLDIRLVSNFKALGCPNLIFLKHPLNV